MFGFPIPLYDTAQCFSQNFTPTVGDNSGFPTPNRREIFYTIKDGNWSDLTIWQTASGRVGKLPTLNDDVYIRNTVSNTSNNVAVNNLFITGVFSFIGTGLGMYIYGNVKCTGTINQINANILLYGSDNYINNYVPNTIEASITYARNDGVPQPIMPLNYCSISLLGISPKYLVSDLLQANGGTGNQINSPFDTRGYNVTFTTAVTFNTGTGDFIANGSTLVFNGGVNWISIRKFEVINSILEFRGGWTWLNTTATSTFANSVINFTTNTQNLQISYSGLNHIIDANSVNIVGNITLNIVGNDYCIFNCPINGTTASSKLTNQGYIQFATLASVSSMTTGIVDFTTYSINLITYGGNYTATIPSYFPTFSNLTLYGTGTKTLGVNTTVNANLSMPNFSLGTGTLECSTYDLVVTGTTIFAASANYILSKTGAGNITFVGLLNIGNASYLSLTGNPNVECRGGITFTSNAASNFGTGTWSFTTNNQTVTTGNSGFTINNMTIGNSITITKTGAISALSITNVLNGTNAGSTFINQGMCYIYSSTVPMTTGIIDITSITNTLGFFGDVTMTLPYTTYNSLTIGGTGIKTLAGTTTINADLFIKTNGTLECSTYDLTVNGATTITATLNGTLSKNASGNILFVGTATCQNTGNLFTFNGNPTVEFRGGAVLGQSGINLGTGNITVSTNNQTFNNNCSINNNVTISGAITLSIAGAFNVHVGTITGDNASSKLLMTSSSTLNYKSATQPMVTGILDTSTNFNAWIYGLNNQDIKGSPTTSPKQVYRSLTLNGTGVKTLQGYVSVINGYTLTSPATLALNGFTLTNP